MAAVSLARSLATALFSLSLLLLARSPSSAHGAHLRGERERVCLLLKKRRACVYYARLFEPGAPWEERYEAEWKNLVHVHGVCIRPQVVAVGKNVCNLCSGGMDVEQWPCSDCLLACGWICVWRRGARRHFMIKSFCEIAERSMRCWLWIAPPPLLR